MADKVHMCETCGKTTDKLGHLCDPVEVDEAYVCDHCASCKILILSALPVAG
jgi:hypothetical protein